MHSVLHIFNGDCAAEAWKKTVHPAPRHIVWRENYLEGPIPPADTAREEFARIRAEYLHTCVPQYTVETLQRFQCALEEELQTLDGTDAAMLWFDDCMFDMLLLARILFLQENSSAKLHLCCENRVLGSERELFLTPLSNFRELSRTTVRLFADTWRAFAGGSCMLAQFLQEGRTKKEFVLDRAMHRYMADHPPDHSPGLSERKLLQLIAGGKHEFQPLFRAFNASEERPFMGDTMCERMLKNLEEKGFLAISEDAEKHLVCRLTEKGKLLK